MKRQANKTPVNDDAAPRFPEIKKDFEEIQKMNSRLIELKIAESPINYASVFKIVSQINRRAVRLNSNLFAAELKEKNNKRAKDEKATTVAPSELPVLLTALDKSIGSFVHNSLFQNINLVNSKDSLKAQTDLETVIKISFSIKEKAKSYKK